MKRWRLVAVALAALAAGCRGPWPGQREEAPAPASVSLAVSVAVVTRAPMRSEVRLLGTTVATRRITIRAPAAGVVSGMRLQGGDQVRRGQVVARIVTREDLAARAGAKIARRLDPQSAEQIDEAVKRYAGEAGIPVIAPQDAAVAQRNVSDGQFVNEFEALLEVIDPASIYVEAAAPIDVLRRIRPGLAATVTSPLHPGVEFPARVAALLPAFSQVSVTSPLRIEFTGAARIREAGAALEALITIKYVPAALVIPEAAVFEDAERGGSYVFVAGRDGRAHRRAVTIGIRSPPRVEVTAGLAPGQRVITSGGYALSDGLEVMAAGASAP